MLLGQDRSPQAIEAAYHAGLLRATMLVTLVPGIESAIGRA